VDNIDAAVTFYGSDAFANSAGSAEVGGISLNAQAAGQIADFLRALNTLENIRSALIQGPIAKLAGIAEGGEFLELMRADTEDGVTVLTGGNLMGRARSHLSRALSFIDSALIETLQNRRNRIIDKAIQGLEAAQNEILQSQQASDESDPRGRTGDLELEAAESGASGERSASPDLTLHQNFPNPFNPYTEIRFTLTRDERVRVRVFNSLGQVIRELADRYFETGEHSVRWDGTDGGGRAMATGIYLYQIQVGNRAYTRTMSLVK
jgi:hypothetical protein